MNTKPNNRGNARRVSKPKLNKSKKNTKPLGRSKMVTAPVAQGRIAVMSRPRITSSANGDIVIRHREYIREIAGSVAFATYSNSINPGQPGSFPWLSTVARSYESYKFESLQFRFETEAPSTASGSIVLAVDYDGNDPAPTSKTQAMAYRSSVRCQPWSSCDHTSLREDLNKRSSYYVRSGSLAANQDVVLYDTGQLYVCRQGQVDTAIVGELYADYVVKLMTPQLGNAGVGESLYGTFTGTVNSAPFATKTGNLPATVVSSGTTSSVSTFTFSQPWEGYVSLIVNGTGFTAPFSTATGTATSVEYQEVNNTATTNGSAIYGVVAQIGDTFILTIANSTISGSTLLWGQADI